MVSSLRGSIWRGLTTHCLVQATDYMIEDVLDGLSEYIRLAPTPDVPCWSGGWDWGDLVKKQAGVRKGCKSELCLLECWVLEQVAERRSSAVRPFKERLSKGTVRPTLTYIELGMQRASTTVPETPIPHEAIQWIYTAIADTPGWQTLFDTGGDYYVELCASSKPFIRRS